MEDGPSRVPNLQAITLGGFALDVDYFLKNPYMDVAQANTELPPVIEWVNFHLQSIIEQELQKEAQVKEAESRAFFDLSSGSYVDRGYATGRGGRPTAGSLVYAVALDNDVITAKKELAVLTGWRSRLQNLLVSLRSKLDLVRSSEATRRLEMSSNNN